MLLKSLRVFRKCSSKARRRRLQTAEKLNFSANQCRIQRNKSAVSAQAYRIESRRFLQEELRKIIPSRVGRELISTHLSMLRMEVVMLLLILLVILIFGFGYGGYLSLIHISEPTRQ